MLMFSIAQSNTATASLAKLVHATWCRVPSLGAGEGEGEGVFQNLQSAC